MGAAATLCAANPDQRQRSEAVPSDSFAAVASILADYAVEALIETGFLATADRLFRNQFGAKKEKLLQLLAGITRTPQGGNVCCFFLRVSHLELSRL